MRDVPVRVMIIFILFREHYFQALQNAQHLIFNQKCSLIVFRPGPFDCDRLCMAGHHKRMNKESFCAGTARAALPALNNILSTGISMIPEMHCSSDPVQIQ